MSSRCGRLREVLPVPPGGGFVVEGTSLQASVQDADQAVGQPAECVVVFEFSGAAPRRRRGRRARRSATRTPRS